MYMINKTHINVNDNCHFEITLKGIMLVVFITTKIQSNYHDSL